MSRHYIQREVQGSTKATQIVQLTADTKTKSRLDKLSTSASSEVSNTIKALKRLQKPTRWCYKSSLYYTSNRAHSSFQTRQLAERKWLNENKHAKKAIGYSMLHGVYKPRFSFIIFCHMVNFSQS